MRLGIKPTVDIVFKTIFGSEERTDLTLSLVNAVLVQAGRRKALSISLMNPFRLGQHLDQKDAILDVRARDESGREFQLEIQIRAIATLPKRMLHNWASRFLSRMAKGEDYAVLHPVVAIWFLERDLFSDSQWFHSFSLRDSKSGFEFGEDELILTIELAKWVRGDETEVRVRYAPELLESELYLWLYFLTEGQDFDPEALPSSLLGTPVQEAVEAMAIFTKSETARHNYEKRLEMRMERASIEVEEREAGRAEGQRPRALEDARRLKALGVDHGIIAQATDLEIHEIESL